MINIDSLAETYEFNIINGNHIDSFIAFWLYNFLNTNRRFPAIFELVTANVNLWRIIAKDASAIFKYNEMIVAEFTPTSDLPFYRFYGYNYMKKSVSIETVLSGLSIKISTLNFNKYVDAALIDKIKSWVAKMEKDLFPSTTIAKGRIENTAVDKTIILYRQPNGCVICGKKATGYVSSTLMREKAVFLVANTCSEDQELAKEHPSFLHFISELFEMGIDLQSNEMKAKMSNEIIDLLSQEIKEALNVSMLSKIYNAVRDETTLTFVRETGFKIILRLRTLMDYGYMINKPNGKQFQRIDSAPDHKNIDFFPDHLHRTFTKIGKKHDVESSYTYGFPLLDLPAITKMLVRAELNEHS